jgi:hypothetical protein
VYVFFLLGRRVVNAAPLPALPFVRRNCVHIPRATCHTGHIHSAMATPQMRGTLESTVCHRDRLPKIPMPRGSWKKSFRSGEPPIRRHLWVQMHSDIPQRLTGARSRIARLPASETARLPSRQIQHLIVVCRPALILVEARRSFQLAYPARGIMFRYFSLPHTMRLVQPMLF